MKDFISKLAFGFIMAQFVPGVIIVVSFSFIYVLFFSGQTLVDYPSVIDEVLGLWGKSLSRQLALLVSGMGFGMAIHGLYWSIQAFLENEFEYEKKKISGQMHPLITWFYDLPVWAQVFVGPVFLVWQSVAFLFITRSFDQLVLEENVSKIKKDNMEAFQYLQDFYLNFAQFYIHTSYALTVAFGSLLAGACMLGWNTSVIIFLVMVYLFAGIFFLVGRVQFRSLYDAEWELKDD